MSIDPDLIRRYAADAADAKSDIPRDAGTARLVIDTLAADVAALLDERERLVRERDAAKAELGRMWRSAIDMRGGRFYATIDGVERDFLWYDDAAAAILSAIAGLSPDPTPDPPEDAAHAD